jgi:hypothetical protein
MGGLSSVLHYGICNRFGFASVVPLFCAPLIESVGQVPQNDAELAAIGPRGREGNELAVVKLVVGNRNQGFVFTTIVPSQHFVGRALSQEQAEHAFDIWRRRGIVFVVCLAAKSILEGEELRCKWSKRLPQLRDSLGRAMDLEASDIGDL